jgi:hypothetical protein
MTTFTTLAGKQFNPRDMVSFLKYEWGKGSPNAKYNRDWFHTAAENVRKNLGVANYAATDPLDPSFDYNKTDWGDVYNTLSAWQTDPLATAEQKATAADLVPMMGDFGVQKDTGIYHPYELQAQAAQITAQGAIDAETAKQTAILKGDGSANTLAFLKQAQTDSVSMLTEQAALLKKQGEANTASGRQQVEADYTGVEADILAGAAKLQSMTGDEYAARGMAFSGTLNQAISDIAASAASELAKAMAQKGARLGKLVNDLVAYTAQIDLDTLTNKTNAVMQYGLQIASLMDKDAQTKSDAAAVLAGLESQGKTLAQLAPINQELARTQAEQDYAAAQKAAAATAFTQKIQLANLGLDQQKQALAEADATAKYQLAYDQLDLDKQKAVVDEMYQKGQLSVSEYNAATSRMNAVTAQTTAAGTGGFKSLGEANTVINKYDDLQTQLDALHQGTDGKWYKTVVNTAGVPTSRTPTADDARTSEILPSLEIPVDVTGIQRQMSQLEPTYRAAITYRDTKTGVQTPLALDTDEVTNVRGFIDTVAKATRGVGVVAYAQSYLAAVQASGTPLNQKELDAIAAFYNNNDRSVYPTGPGG